MVKSRVPETDHGITGAFNTQAYDIMMRNLRDKGWIETSLVIGSGISSGLALEVGPGPGYLGLEWLKNTENTALKGLDISDDMIAIARKNASEYALSDRVEYVKSDAQKMPFKDNYFDAVFTNGSLHEWAHPEEIIKEINRVLKHGGKYLISDLRRNMNPFMKWFLWIMTKPKEMRPGLISSINASYTLAEIKDMFRRAKLQDWHASKNMLGIIVTGQKPV